MKSNPPRVGQVVTFGPYRLLVTERLLEKNGEPVQLGGRALDILIALVERAGDVVGKNELLTRVWPNMIVDESSLRVHIAGLRKALGEGSTSARYIVNVPGRGYSFVAPVGRGPELKATSSIAPRSAEPGARLPPRLTRMVGREEVIRDLSKQIVARRLVTIHGPGGIGKTTLAVALGHALLAEFGGAVCFADLGLVTDPDLVAGSLASALGVQVQSSDAASAVVNYLRDRRIVVILDCCEHVIGPLADLAERMVQEAPELCVVATSREPLRVEGEHVYRLSPLQSPPDDTELTAEQALSFPAAQLLIERATAGNHLFDLTDADAPIVAEICRKLDGIALAIELAAGRVSTHGLRETAALLDKRMKLLWRGRRTASPRHQTMTATLDWSYHLITELERTVLCRLSVFVGSFTLDAALAVVADDDFDTSDVIDAVEQLAAKSLISTANVSETAMRYRLLDATRAYARAKLDHLNEASAIYGRHALYWANRLERAYSTKAIAGHSAKDDVSAEDLGNVRSALEFSFSNQGDVSCGIALAAAAAPLFTNLSLLSECFQWTEQGLSALPEAKRGTRWEMELQAAFGHSMMFTRGNSGRALAALMRGLELAEELEDRFYQFRLLSDLHMFRLRTGRYQDTLALAKQARAVADTIADPVGLSAAHRLLSTSHHLVGNLAEALGHLDTWQPPPSQVTDSSAFNASRIPRIGLSRVLWLSGYPDQAIRALRSADEEAVNIHSPVPYCIVAIWGASVLRWLGDWDAVDHRADRLIAYATKHCLDPHIAVGIGLKGTVLINRGEIDRGNELLYGSLSKLRADHYELYAPSLSHALADGLGLGGRLEEAVAIVNDSIAIVSGNGGSIDMPELLHAKGMLLMKMGDPEGAEASLSDAIDWAERHSALSLHLRAASSLAQLRLSQKRAPEAGAMLAEVYGRFVEGFETADLKAAKALLDEIGAPSMPGAKTVSPRPASKGAHSDRPRS